MWRRKQRAVSFLLRPRSSLFPRSVMTTRIRTRFLVVGSGVAGLHTAWRASEHGDVYVLTKRTLFDSSTAYAQGGIAAALGAGDSPELHRQDTLAAGAALCDREAVEVLVEEGPARVLDLIVRAKRCVGVRASVAGQAVEILADATVMATGGCGQVYRYTTNPQVATGDGFAIAHRAGATLSDMEFVQFHPTALDTPENPLALISEAVRGEGAILLNGEGRRFMPERHALAELAPRDVVAREIFRERQRTGRVTLDARKLGRGFQKRFPGIFALCRARGIDPSREPIPVTPAAHYMMGGIVTDLVGRSSLAGLYACGEVARTGVHGANRLASNSLLEGLVFAERVARDLATTPALRTPLPRKGSWQVPLLVDRGAAQVAADDVRRVMWEFAGINRTAKGLRTCLAAMDEIEARLPEGATEEQNLVGTARLIAEAALLRKESRGGHFRSDFPRAKRKWKGRHIEW